MNAWSQIDDQRRAIDAIFSDSGGGQLSEYVPDFVVKKYLANPAWKPRVLTPDVDDRLVVKSLVVFATDDRPTPYTNDIVSAMRFVSKKFESGDYARCQVFFIPADEAKRLPAARGALLEPTHINSGVATGAKTGIFVYRRQDGIKVLMHEMLHVGGVGVAGWPTADVVRDEERRMQEEFSLSDGSVRFSEALVEAVACHLHVLWEAETYRDGKVEETYAATIERRKVAAGQFMQHFDGKKWAETTHSFSYVILATAALMDVGTFARNEYFAKDFAGFVRHVRANLESVTKLRRSRGKLFRLV